MTRPDDMTEQGATAKVTEISPDGIRLLVAGQEFVLPYSEFPWFKGAEVPAILQVQRPAPGHLYWPDLDIDLELATLQRPDLFPLIYR
jgi:hypothetical protein